MTVTEITPSDVVERCGGAKVLKAYLADRGTDIHLDTIYKWTRQGGHGIPDRYWPDCMALGGLTAQEMLQANENLRRTAAANAGA